jgi:hypothetical protein
MLRERRTTDMRLIDMFNFLFLLFSSSNSGLGQGKSREGKGREDRSLGLKCNLLLNVSADVSLKEQEVRIIIYANIDWVDQEEKTLMNNVATVH